jgi:hypothetical protein
MPPCAQALPAIASEAVNSVSAKNLRGVFMMCPSMVE